MEEARIGVTYSFVFFGCRRKLTFCISLLCISPDSEECARLALYSDDHHSGTERDGKMYDSVVGGSSSLRPRSTDFQLTNILVTG